MHIVKEKLIEENKNLHYNYIMSQIKHACKQRAVNLLRMRMRNFQNVKFFFFQTKLLRESHFYLTIGAFYNFFGNLVIT